jgi:long-chain fatty acid transport protein
MAVAAFGAMQLPAQAGGIERGGYNIDLLFDRSPAAVEATATYVMPQRKLKNATDTDPSDGNLNQLGYSSTANEDEGYWSPRVGAKFGYQDFDCMVDYSQPYGAHTDPGARWAGAAQNVETKINSDNYAATCSYRFDVGPGQLRFIGGANYLQMDGFKERLVGPPGAPGIIGDGVGRLDLEGDGWGWRAGMAYEIPEYAMRASLVYYSEVKLDNITGVLDLSKVNGLVLPVYGSTAMPDALELKLQSGIAPDWLAFGSVKWTDWSQLQQIPFRCTAAGIPLCGPSITATSLDLGYRDGWTVTAGIGHKFDEQWSGAMSVTWDRGTSQEYGAQSDTWALTTGVAYSPNKNVEIRLAGVIGIMTSGSSTKMTVDGNDIGDEVDYDYGNDLVTAINASLKIKF